MIFSRSLEQTGSTEPSITPSAGRHQTETNQLHNKGLVCKTVKNTGHLEKRQLDATRYMEVGEAAPGTERPGGMPPPQVGPPAAPPRPPGWCAECRVQNSDWDTTCAMCGGELDDPMCPFPHCAAGSRSPTA